MLISWHVFAVPVFAEDVQLVQHAFGKIQELEKDLQDEICIAVVDANAFAEQDLEEIIQDNTDLLVCGSTADVSLANNLYHELKHKYCHFYHIIPRHSQEMVFVASQYPINDIKFVPQDIEENSEQRAILLNVRFDQQREGQFSLTNLIDRKNLQIMPAIHSHNHHLAVHKKRSIISQRNAREHLGFFATLKMQNKRFGPPQRKRHAHDHFGDIVMCKKNEDRDRNDKARDSEGSLGYSARGYKDSNGNTSAQVGVDYSRKQEDGKEFVVGIDGKTEQNAKGDKNHAVEVSVRGRI